MAHIFSQSDWTKSSRAKPKIKLQCVTSYIAFAKTPWDLHIRNIFFRELVSKKISSQNKKILSSSQFKYTITHSVWWVIFGAFFVCDLFWPWLGWLTEKIRKPAFHSILSKTINFCKNIVSTQAYFFSDDINPLFWTRIILILGLSALKIEFNWSELFKKHSLV